jgi:tetratricopeptide (TPR) repeat protein
VYQSIISRQNLNFEQADFTKDKQGLIATLDISEYNLTSEELAEMWVSLLHDHIELYYVDETMYSYIDDNVSYLSIVCPYKYNTYSSRQVVDDELDKHISLLKELTDGLSPEEKACYVCTYISDLYTYAVDENDEAVLDVDSTMISGILNKSGVCSGYSRLYAFLCRQLGMECLFVTGNLDEAYHAWCYVYANGWYAVDPTFVDGGIDGLLLAGREFISDYAADLPGLHYDSSQCMKIGYPLPELEELGYFQKIEKIDIQTTDEKKTEEDNTQTDSDLSVINNHSKTETYESVQKNEESADTDIEANHQPAEETNKESTQQNEESVNVTDNMTESIVTDIETTPDLVPSTSLANDVINQEKDIQSELSSYNTTENDIPAPAQELSPMELAEKYYNLACQAQEEGNLEACIEYYQISLKYCTDHAALFNIACAYQSLGEIDNAVNYYLMAYSNGDGMPSISNCLSMLDAADLSLEKQLEYELYILQWAPVKTVYEDIARIYASMDDFETAQEYLDIAEGM